MRSSKILGLEGPEKNHEGLWYYHLLAHKLCINGQMKLLSYAAFSTKPFGRVHESVFGHQGDQPKVPHGAL